jgi:transposase
MTCPCCGGTMIPWDINIGIYFCLKCEYTGSFNDNRGG